MAKTATRDVDLEPIDRLEEKVKLLVGDGRSDDRRPDAAAEENQRLTRELERCAPASRRARRCRRS